MHGRTAHDEDTLLVSTVSCSVPGLRSVQLRVCHSPSIHRWIVSVLSTLIFSRWSVWLDQMRVMSNAILYDGCPYLQKLAEVDGFEVLLIVGLEVRAWAAYAFWIVDHRECSSGCLLRVSQAQISVLTVTYWNRWTLIGLSIQIRLTTHCHLYVNEFLRNMWISEVSGLSPYGAGVELRIGCFAINSSVAHKENPILVEEITRRSGCYLSLLNMSQWLQVECKLWYWWSQCNTLSSEKLTGPRTISHWQRTYWNGVRCEHL